MHAPKEVLQAGICLALSMAPASICLTQVNLAGLNGTVRDGAGRNRAQYGLPLADFSTSVFGQIVSTVNTGPVGTGTLRQIQFSLRAEF